MKTRGLVGPPYAELDEKVVKVFERSFPL